MKNKTLVNMFLAWISQLATIVSGFILPRIILSYFGSEVNGLVSSTAQFLGYINLFEGGLGSVFLASLYKPLAENDTEQLSRVINTGKRYFRKIAFVFSAYTIALCLVYPIVVSSSFSFIFVSSLILVLALQIFIQYTFSITYKLLLQADQKVYVVLIVQTIITILNLGLIVFAVSVWRSVHIVKLISAALYLMQPIVFNTYVKKHYNLLYSNEIDVDFGKRERWSCFSQNIAFFIHSNTDISILTLLKGLNTVSVYAVYAMVAGGIKNLIIAFSQVFSPKIGNALSKGDSAEIESQINQYEFISYFISTVFFGCCFCLVLPFVKIYSSGVTDVSYDEPVFAFFLVLSEFFYCIRNPYVAVVYSAGEFKKTAWAAYFEAGINILLSVLLVFQWGLIGVAIGTCVAMAFRGVFHVIYLKNHIVYRPFRKPITRFLVSVAVILTGSYVFRIVCFIDISSYLYWIMAGIECFIIFSFLSIVFNYLFDRDTTMQIIHSFARKG